MKIEQIKSHLKKAKTISFELPNGQLVPSHFHVTEVGRVVKDFIDCGGTRRHEEVANFQLWEAEDYDHRLHPEKLVNIIELSQKTLGIGDNLEIEVEYQGATIGKYNLDINNNGFVLVAKKTACLALDSCGVDEKKAGMITIADSGGCCTPESGCC